MKSLVVFLNELSFTSENISSPEAMLPYVLSALAAVRAARKLRDDLVVIGQVRLSGVVFGNGTHSMAAILHGDRHKEEWRLLKSLDQSSPWEAYADSRSGELQEVKFLGRVAIGMLWAKQNESAIVSFAFPPDWDASHVEVQFDEMDEDCNITSAEVTIPNLSKPEHVTTHRTLIDNYGRTMSASSMVYEGDGFVVRMFFNDHNPPHFHVMLHRDSPETVAKYAIRTMDRLSGNLVPALRERVEAWASARITDLMNNWEQCRMGRHPFFLHE